MNSSKRLTANIIIAIALIALGCAAVFTINDGVNSAQTNTPTSNFAPNNNAPRMNNNNMGTPPEMNGDNNSDTEQNEANAQRNGRPGKKQSDTENTADAATAQLTTSESSDDEQQSYSPSDDQGANTGNGQAPQQQDITSEVKATDNKLIIDFILAGTEFFAMGTIITYLLLSRFNSYSPKEVIKK